MPAHLHASPHRLGGQCSYVNQYSCRFKQHTLCRLHYCFINSSRHLNICPSSSEPQSGSAGFEPNPLTPAEYSSAPGPTQSTMRRTVAATTAEARQRFASLIQSAPEQEVIDVTADTVAVSSTIPGGGQSTSAVHSSDKASSSPLPSGPDGNAITDSIVSNSGSSSSSSSSTSRGVNSDSARYIEPDATATAHAGQPRLSPVSISDASATADMADSISTSEASFVAAEALRMAQDQSQDLHVQRPRTAEEEQQALQAELQIVQARVQGRMQHLFDLVTGQTSPWQQPEEQQDLTGSSLLGDQPDNRSSKSDRGSPDTQQVASAQEEEEAEEEQEEEALAAAVGGSWGTGLLLTALVIVFALQWWPLLGTVATELRVGHLDALTAVALISPYTEVAAGLQLSAMDLAFGSYKCLITSSLVHGGLIPILVAARMLRTAGWTLQLACGPVILLITYFMAGMGTSAAQLLLGRQASAIAGPGAVVGMYSALAVHAWRNDEGFILQPFDVLPLGFLFLLALYQPLFGIWGFVGGVVGGAAAALWAYNVLYILRIAIGLPLLAGIAVCLVLVEVPRIIVAFITMSVVTVYAGVGAVIKTIRGL